MVKSSDGKECGDNLAYLHRDVPSDGKEYRGWNVMRTVIYLGSTGNTGRLTDGRWAYHGVAA